MSASAVARLGSPDTWCAAAAELAAAGDASVLPALVAAYDSRAEGGKVCLLDAVGALDAVGWAASHAAAPDAATRRVAARLPGLVSDPAHLPVLERLAGDVDDAVRATALRSLATQPQDAAWRATCVRLLAAPRADVRLAAARALSRRPEGDVRAALASAAAADPALAASLR